MILSIGLQGAPCQTRILAPNRSVGRTIRPNQTHTKRATGIEPALEAWKASVQPQHFARAGDHRTVPTPR
jgi:hypothetical protein